ncbi:conotoxin [Bacteriovorax sp. Seq25_V]|uniref:conotoxin n=1 Tax=Bacteriovorax sp. Seq25_V TaxID=1201288 RepID=UPI000389E2C2|nr:conotoxin [Bacteriovorax sp. Seq25_V]EQC47241.1 hypothetical protein M900_0481 [Bacteriovorax sp. Seq25_V]
MKKVILLFTLVLSIQGFAQSKGEVPKEVTAHIAKLLGLSANNTKSLTNNCSVGGSQCIFDNDCCSDNCLSGVCQAGYDGRTYGGGGCTFDSDCLSNNCFSGTCQEGTGCTSIGQCKFDSECCSGNCTNGQCGQSCVAEGDYCTMDIECCTGSCNYNTCTRPRRRGNDCE